MQVLVGFIVRRHWAVLTAIVGLLLIAGYGVVRLGFNDGLAHVFSSQNQVFSDFVADREKFGGAEAGIAIHLSAPDFADPDTFRAAENFTLDLSLVPGIAGSVSVYALRSAPDAQGDTQLLLNARLEQEADIRDALNKAVVHPLNRGRLLTADLKNLLIVAQPQSQELEELTAIVSEITALGDALLTPQSIDYVATGLPQIRVSTVGLLIRDQMVINVVAAAIGFVLCLIAFKGLVPAMIAGLPAVFALVFVLGFMGYWGTGINTATNALPVLILVMAFADSMHLTFETRRRLGQGAPYQKAIIDAFVLAAPPCILASVTTAIAFGSLMLSGSELVSGLGAAGSIGVLISALVVLVVNPLMSILAARFDLRGWTRGQPAQPLMFPDKLWRRILDVCLKRARLVAVIGMIVLVGALGVFSQVGARYSFLEYVPKDSESFVALQEVEQIFAPLSSYDVMVPVEANLDGPIDGNLLARIGAVHAALVAQFGEDRVLSLWSVAQWVMPQSPVEAGPVLTRMFARAGLLGDTGRALGFISQDGSLARLAVLTRDAGSSQVIEEAGRIENIINTALGEASSGGGTHDARTGRVGGLLYMSAVVSTEMIFDLNRSFLAAMVFSGLLIGVWMRSARVGVIALVINVMPIALVGAFLVISGNQLQFTSGLALTIAFGIAVDDTLHALNRLRPKYVAKVAVTEADIRQAFGSVAPVLTATSVILSLALAATFLSGMPSIAYFGQLSIAVFLLALTADLLVLPALLKLMQKDAKN